MLTFLNLSSSQRGQVTPPLTKHEHRRHFLHQIWSEINNTTHITTISISINPLSAPWVAASRISHKGYQSAYLFIRVFSVKILKGFMRSVEGFYNLPLFKPRYIYMCLYKIYPIINYLESSLSENFQRLIINLCSVIYIMS